MHMGKVVSGAVGFLLLMSSVAGAQQQSPAARVNANADARLEGVIESKLEEQPELVARGLDARVVGKQVTLTGAVRSEDDKALAERVAHVPGINQVNNLLEVQPGAADDSAAAQPASATAQGQQAARRALSDPYRQDPLVGTSPQERIPERDKMLRTMGMEDPKLKKQREQAQKNSQNTMTPTDSPPANSEHPETGNQSAPPK
jgi:BON domain